MSKLVDRQKRMYQDLNSFLARGGPLSVPGPASGTPFPGSSGGGNSGPGVGAKALSTLGKAIDFVSRPLYGTVNAASENLSKVTEGTRRGKVTGDYSEAVKGIVKTTIPISNFPEFWEGLTATESENKDKKKIGVDLIDQATKALGGKKPTWKDDKVATIARGVGGFGVDVGLDPLSYVPYAGVVSTALKAVRAVRGVATAAKSTSAAKSTTALKGTTAAVGTPGESFQKSAKAVPDAPTSAAESLKRTVSQSRQSGTAANALGPVSGASPTDQSLVNRLASDLANAASTPRAATQASFKSPLPSTAGARISSAASEGMSIATAHASRIGKLQQGMQGVRKALSSVKTNAAHNSARQTSREVYLSAKDRIASEIQTGIGPDSIAVRRLHDKHGPDALTFSYVNDLGQRAVVPGRQVVEALDNSADGFNAEILRRFVDSDTGQRIIQSQAELRTGVSPSVLATADLPDTPLKAFQKFMNTESAGRSALREAVGEPTWKRIQSLPAEKRMSAVEALHNFARDPDRLTPGQVKEMPDTVQRFLRDEFALTPEMFDQHARNAERLRMQREMAGNAPHNALTPSGRSNIDPIALEAVAASVGVKTGLLLNRAKDVFRNIAGDMFNPKRAREIMDGQVHLYKAKDGKVYGVIDGQINQHALMTTHLRMMRRVDESITATSGGRLGKHEWQSVNHARRYGTDLAPSLGRSWEMVEKAMFDSGKLSGVKLGKGVDAPEVPLQVSSIFNAAEAAVAEGRISSEVVERLLYNGSTSIRFTSLVEAVAHAVVGGSRDDIVKALQRQIKDSVRGKNGNPLTSNGVHGIFDRAGIGDGFVYRPRKGGGFSRVVGGERLTNEALDLIDAITPMVKRDTVTHYAAFVQKSGQDAAEMVYRLEDTISAALAQSSGAGVAQLSKITENMANMAAEIGGSRLAIFMASQKIAEKLPTGAVKQAENVTRVAESIQKLASKSVSPEDIARHMTKLDQQYPTYAHAMRDADDVAMSAARNIAEESPTSPQVREIVDELRGDVEELFAGTRNLPDGQRPSVPIDNAEFESIVKFGQELIEQGVSGKELGKQLYQEFVRKVHHISGDQDFRFKIIGKIMDRLQPKAGGRAFHADTDPNLYKIGTGVDRAAIRAETGWARFVDFWGDSFNVRHRTSVDGHNIYEFLREGFGIAGKSINESQRAIRNLGRRFNVRIDAPTGAKGVTALSHAFHYLKHENGSGADAVRMLMESGTREGETVRSAVEALRPVMQRFFDLDGSGMGGDMVWLRTSNPKFFEDAWAYYKMHDVSKAPLKEALERGNPAEAWRNWDIKDPAEFLTRYNLVAHRALSMKHTSDSLAHAMQTSGLASRTARPGFAKPERVGKSYMFSGLQDSGLYYDKRVLDAITEIDHRMFANRGFTGSGGKFVDEVFDPAQRVWKTATTIYRVGHHTRNLVSNAGISYLAEGPRNFMRSGVIAAKALSRRGNPQKMGADGSLPRGDLEHLLDGTFQVAKGGDDIAFTVGRGKNKIEVTFNEVIEEAARRGALRTFQIAEDIIQERTGSLSSKLADKLSLTHTKLGRGIGNASEVMDQHGYVQQAVQHFMNNAYRVGKKGGYATKRELWDASYARSYKFHPDSSSLTPFEAKYMRRVFPFYTWFRGTLPAIMAASWMYPGRAVQFHKASYAAAESMGMDPESYANPFPEDVEVPDFLRERVFGVNFRNPLNGDMYATNPGFAHIDLAQDLLGSGPRITEDGETGEVTQQGQLSNMVENVLRYAAQMLSPAFKLPADLLSGTNTASGDEIRDASEHVDSFIPNVSYLNNMLGISLTGSIAKRGIDPKKSVESGRQTGLFDGEGNFAPGETQGRTFWNWLSGQAAVKVNSPKQAEEERERHKQHMIDQGHWEDFDNKFEGAFDVKPWEIGYFPYRTSEQRGWMKDFAEQAEGNPNYIPTSPYPEQPVEDLTESQKRMLEQIMRGGR